MSSVRLALVPGLLLFTIACAGYSSAPASPSPAGAPATDGPSSPVTIPADASGLGDRAYAPDALTITVGTAVTWTNRDSTAHTSTSDGHAWDSGVVSPGAQFSFTFQTAGTFRYHCTLHPGMVGTVVVR
jgi:plastocyanin